MTIKEIPVLSVNNIPFDPSVGTARRTAGATGNAVRNGDTQKLRAACEDFEALFIKQMLSSMRATIHRSELTDGGFAADIYEDMLYDEYAARMARTADLGISEMLLKQLT